MLKILLAIDYSNGQANAPYGWYELLRLTKL
jgi:hypothetical protein